MIYDADDLLAVHWRVSVFVCCVCIVSLVGAGLPAVQDSTSMNNGHSAAEQARVQAYNLIALGTTGSLHALHVPIGA